MQHTIVHNDSRQPLGVERLLRMSEVQEVLNCGRSVAYQLVATGEIPSIRIGRSIRVRQQALDRWLTEREQTA